MIGFNNSGSQRVQFAVNGTILVVGTQEGGYIFEMSAVLMLAAGDYVEVLAPTGQQVLLTYIPSPYFVLILETPSGGGGGGGGGADIVTAELAPSADYSMPADANWHDVTGASVVLSGGTWVGIGTVQVLGETAAAAYVDLRITDGSTHYGQGRVLTGSIGGNADYNPVPLICASFVLASPTTLKLQANTGGGTGSTKVIRFGALTGAAPEPSRVVFIKLDGVTLGVAPSGCELHGSAQSGMSNTTPLVWNDPATFDPDGYWNSATPTRLTVPSGKGGRLFHVYAGGEFLDPSNNAIKMRQNLYLNGAPFALGQIDFQQYISYISVVVLLQDGDYLEVQPYRQDGTDWKLIVNDMLPRFVLVPAG